MSSTHAFFSEEAVNCEERKDESSSSSNDNDVDDMNEMQQLRINAVRPSQGINSRNYLKNQRSHEGIIINTPCQNLYKPHANIRRNRSNETDTKKRMSLIDEDDRLYSLQKRLNVLDR